MLPDRGFSKIYVTLEGETIGRLCRAAKLPLSPNFSFVTNPDAWNTVFRLHKVGSQHRNPDTTASYFPGKSIKTDGVACSVVMHKKIAVPAPSKRGAGDELLPTDFTNQQSHRPKVTDRVVGIDPGKRPDILVGVVRATNAPDEEVFNVSLKEWRERAGFNKRHQVFLVC